MSGMIRFRGWRGGLRIFGKLAVAACIDCFLFIRMPVTTRLAAQPFSGEGGQEGREAC